MRRSPGIETFLCRDKSTVCIHHAEEFLTMNTLQQSCQQTLVTQTRAPLILRGRKNASANDKRGYWRIVAEE